jgi:hypothetical protein
MSTTSKRLSPHGESQDLPWDPPLSPQDLVDFHCFRLAEQVDEWITEAIANLTGAKKLLAELERKNMVKTPDQRATFDAVQHLVQCALAAGDGPHVPMLQYSNALLWNFGDAFEKAADSEHRAVL